MKQAVVYFAGNAVGLAWQGEPAERLVMFLFGQSLKSQPADPADRPEPTVHFELISPAEDSPQYQLSNNLGEKQVGTARDLAYYFIERVTYYLADQSQGGMVIHAACLSRKGQALLLPGASGSGKSTLALWLSQQGYDYLSDELVYIPFSGLDVLGLPRPVHLKKASMGLFAALAGSRGIPASPGTRAESSLMIQPEKFSPQARLAAILFPRYTAGAPLELVKISGAHSVLNLTGCLVNARNLPDNGFPELLRLSRSLPAYSLTYSSFDNILAELNKLPA